VQISSIGMSKPDDIFLEKIIKTFHNLKFLNLKNYDITDKTLFLLKNLESLEELDVSLCLISDEGLYALSELKNLKKLNITGCFEIKDKGLNLLTQKCPELNINKDDHLIDEDFTSLEKKCWESMLEFNNIHKDSIVSEINLKPYANILNDKIIKHIVTHFSDLKSLTLYGNTITHAGLNYLQNLSKLETLKFHMSMTDKNFRQLIKLKQLKSLEFFGFKNTDQKNLKIIAENLTSLEALNINDCSNLTYQDLSALKALTNLKKLNLTNAPDITDTFLKVMLKDYKNLEDLDISYCCNITDEGLKFIVENLENLEGLDLSGCRKITDDGLKNIIKNLKNLKRLNICDSKDITNEDLKFIFQNLENLESLGLSYSSKKEGYLQRFQNFKNLKRLNLTGSRLTDNDFKFICENFKNLEDLTLMGCYRITHKALQSISENLKNLKTLNLEGCIMNDKGLKSLLNLKNLNHVDIRFSRIDTVTLKDFEGRGLFDFVF
jgi:hypothetical protein